MASPPALPAFPALAAAVALAVAVPVGAAGAQGGTAPVPGCEYAPIDLATYGGAPLEDPPEIRSSGGTLTATLTVGYTGTTIAGCPVRLRTYDGALVGPTLRVRPGDTLSITLDNGLPPNPHPHPMPMDINVPHDFNTTNLHTHGLHVSPSGNSDNVLLSIEPGETFDYEIAIPDDHPPGTFWYHAHRHGSTALQVSSGMAGSIVIEGGLDDVPAIAEAGERILLFQQIAYDRQGVIESYDDFGPGGWQASHRQTLINGQVAPTIEMTPGAVERWRMIHGGVRETLRPVLRRVGPLAGAPDYARLTATALSALPIAVPQHEIAVDGLALGRIDTWDIVELQPGQRSDVLVKAPMVEEPTEFLLTDGALPGDRSLLGEAEPERILARVVVAGAGRDMPLPTEAEVAGLAPFEPVTDDELDGAPQAVEFSIGSRICPPEGPCVPCQTGEDGCATRFMVNDRPYDPDDVRTLRLGTAAEWTLSSAVANHPFHIHVNPFEATRIGPDGLPQTVWRDTLFVRQDEAPLRVRTRYERFTGRFVLHCHILDHEDQGMMQLVEIVD